MAEKNEKRLEEVEKQFQGHTQNQSSLKEGRTPDEQNRLKDQENRRA